jgi:cytochrome c biogenesis protein
MQGGVLTSIDPRPLNPEVAVLAYQGYLGLDSGLPQSVYSLDRSQIERGRLTEVGRANLAVGETLTLPDGTAITFTGVDQFAALQFSHDPGQVWGARRGDRPAGRPARAAPAAPRALLRPRRPRPDGGGTVLSVGSLTRGGGESATSFAELTGQLRAALDERSPTPSAPPPGGGRTGTGGPPA